MNSKYDFEGTAWATRATRATRAQGYIPFDPCSVTGTIEDEPAIPLADAETILADIVSDIGDEAALPAVLDWYADDHDDIARLPRAFVAAMVREFLGTYRGPALSPATPAPVQCGTCTHWREYRPHLGHCDRGHRQAIGGNWATTRRQCEGYANE
ncbi:MAG: hypothetical protein H6954_05535 [Chromatiaceae bacterium]|nr:hypothetical protein [Chromatiaceae bacterium]